MTRRWMVLAGAALAAAPATETSAQTAARIAGAPAVVAEARAADDTVKVARATPAAAAPAKAERPVAADSAGETKAAATTIEVGSGTVRFGGIVQAWYMGGSESLTSTFRVRRAELRFAGALSPAARWTVMVDPAKALKLSGSGVSQSSLLLQDAFVTLELLGAQVDAGQFKLPLTREGAVMGSAKLETVERALFIDEGKYGNIRDLGFQVSAALLPALDVQVGVFNGAGEGQNATDVDDAKVVAGRVEAGTPLPGLSLGASGAWSGEEEDASPRRDRLGVDALYVRGPLTLRSEWMRGWDAALEREGYYGLAAYRIGQAELAARYDSWDRDTRSETGLADRRERDYVASLAYFVGGPGAKVQAGFVHRTFDDGSPDDRLLLINVQTAW